jgi:hypothetical protein
MLIYSAGDVTHFYTNSYVLVPVSVRPIQDVVSYCCGTTRSVNTKHLLKKLLASCAYVFTCDGICDVLRSVAGDLTNFN